ncbi:MAG TPA: DUF499 domain-containing protein [Chthoniobacterales bacterium]
MFRVMHREPGEKAFYCDPKNFFSSTYATPNLQQFCRVVLRQLAGESGGESILNVAQTFGGGKSHTLAALYYLVTLGKKLPTDEASVQAILNAAKLDKPPTAIVAGLSLDKWSWVNGGSAKSPIGEVRKFRMPWNSIAWQLLGEQGLKILNLDETKPGYDTPPGEEDWNEVLSAAVKANKGALILIDEFLMWAHDAASPDPTGQDGGRGMFWADRLKNFFQKLGQAVVNTPHCSLVVSLLATDVSKTDEVGQAILAACSGGLNRQAELKSPVEKEDVAELLRRRMFEKFPENQAEIEAQIAGFWDRMKKASPVRAGDPNAKSRFVTAYPFHPDLIERFYGKWTHLRQFQRTRNVLQTFSKALREAEAWDESPIVSTQVFLNPPDAGGVSSALRALADVAMKSSDANPPWEQNLSVELGRAVQAQKSDAAGLSGREIESACVAAFLYSQPTGQEADLHDIRWLTGATCDVPVIFNNGLKAWRKLSWYLEPCERTEPSTELPMAWRMGPKPNITQMHDSYVQQALGVARIKFDELAGSLKVLGEGIPQGVSFHRLPSDPSKLDDNEQFRLALLGSDHAHQAGGAVAPDTLAFLTTHSSPTDQRVCQNVMLVVTPSVTGLGQAEAEIASWLAWGEVRQREGKNLTDLQLVEVQRNERDTKKNAESAVRNAFEVVLYVDKTGAPQTRKFTMGAEAMFPALLREKDLRLFDQRIEPLAIMPGGLYPVWPAGQAAVQVKDLYQSFARQPKLPKLISPQTIVNTVAEGVSRGLLAVRYVRPDGSADWFWRCSIPIAGWEANSEAWLPQDASVDRLPAAAVLPESLGGLWPQDDSPVQLSTLCAWFDGTQEFEETQQGVAEKHPLPKVDYKAVHQAVADAVEQGKLWLVFGNESVLGERPSTIQLDPSASLRRPPQALRSLELLPAALPDAWSSDPSPKTTVAEIYSALKAQRGMPWPSRQFVDVLNGAINQGVMLRGSGSGEIKSAFGDAAVVISVPSQLPPPPTPPPSPSGSGFTSNTIRIEVAALQDLAEDVAPQLTKLLSGCSPGFEIRLQFEGTPPSDLTEINKLMQQFDPDWKI